MGTIKGLSDCLAQGRALRILDKHVRPRERLECDPMQSNRAAKRADCSNAADLAKHDARLGLANFDVNHCFAPAFGAKAPLPSSRYIVEPTREIRSDCRQIPAVKTFLASIVFVSVFPPTGT